VGRDSAGGIATRCRLVDRVIESRWGGGGRDFPHQSKRALWPTQPPIQRVPGLFPGGKAAEAWRWPPTTSSAKAKERVELYLYSSSGPSWSVLGWTYHSQEWEAWRMSNWTDAAGLIQCVSNHSPNRVCQMRDFSTQDTDISGFMWEGISLLPRRLWASPRGLCCVGLICVSRYYIHTKDMKIRKRHKLAFRAASSVHSDG